MRKYNDEYLPVQCAARFLGFLKPRYLSGLFSANLSNERAVFISTSRVKYCIFSYFMK